MKITINSAYLELPENYIHNRNGSLQLDGKVMIDAELIYQATTLATKRLKEKYPNVHVAPESKICFSRRPGESQLTASVKMCIGDGDYVSRVVRVDLPEIVWNSKD